MKSRIGSTALIAVLILPAAAFAQSGGAYAELDLNSGPAAHAPSAAFDGWLESTLAIADAAENSHHLVSPEDAIRIAMARQ